MSLIRIFHGTPSACFHLTGSDAMRFVTSQLSARVPHPTESSRAYGLLLNARGRILADAHVFAESAESCLVWSYECPSAVLHDALSANLIADDVTIDDLRETLKFTVVSGFGTDAMLKDLRYPVPTGSLLLASESHYLTRYSACADESFVFIGEAAFHQQILGQFSGAESYDFDHELRQFLRIDSKTPSIPQDAGQRHLPQEAGLDTLVDYGKGCFPGQEIMAQFRRGGKLTKRLCRFRTATPIHRSDLPLPIHSEGMEVGRITSAAHWNGQSLAMGMLRTRAATSTLFVKTKGSDLIAIELL